MRAAPAGMGIALLGCALGACGATPAAPPMILSVGPNGMFATPCRALTAAADGSVVEIDGSVAYTGDVCAFSANDLTIRGVNGRPRIDAGGLHAAGKGIWVVQGSGTVIDNVELTGAKVPDRNGAAIRLEGNGLTVRRSHIHRNENGILTHNDGTGDILIETSEFGHNGHGDGYSHNVYVGKVGSLVFRFNHSHDANVGHNLKSRAQVNTIAYNRFSSTGGADGGQPSYEIDLPNGGTSHVIGNIIQQPASNQNPVLLAYAMEGASHPGRDLYVVNNTFLNDDPSGGTFIAVGADIDMPVLIQNNLFAGPGSMTDQRSATRRSNHSSRAPAFVDRHNHDLRPRTHAAFIDAGTEPLRTRAGMPLRPVMQYRHGAGGMPRPQDDRIDIGAYEAGPP